MANHSKNLANPTNEQKHLMVLIDQDERAGLWETRKRHLREAYNITPAERWVLETLAATQAYWHVKWDGRQHHIAEGHGWVRQHHPDAVESLMEKGLLQYPRVDGDPVTNIDGRVFLDLTSEARDLIDQAIYAEDDCVYGDLGEHILHALGTYLVANLELMRGNRVYPYRVVGDYQPDVAVAESVDANGPSKLVEVETMSDWTHIQSDYEWLRGPHPDQNPKGLQKMHSEAEVVWVAPNRKTLVQILDKLQAHGYLDLEPPQSPDSPGRWTVPDYSISRLNELIQRRMPPNELAEVHTFRSLYQTLREHDPWRVDPVDPRNYTIVTE